jgi:6-phosphogluconolactonase (cycloisomerase 2 family)
MHLTRGLSAKVAIGIGVLFIAAAAPAAADVLTSQQTFMDGVAGVTGLQAVRQVIVSPDGKNVYTAGEGQSAITVWSRAHDGSLKEIQVLEDKVGGITGINFVDNLSVSPDGRNVYAAGILSKTFVTFSRNAATGELTEVQVLTDGVDVPSGLNGVVFNATSPDGKNVYSAATLDGAVVVFARNRRTGLLTPIQIIQEGVGGVTGLTGAFPVTVSRDGKNVYVGARVDHTVLVFSRAGNGKLTLIQTLTEGTDGVIGIDGARYITEAFEGNVVYVAGVVHSTIAVLARDHATGKLSQIQVLINHVNAVDMNTPTGLVESFDHQHLFVTAFGSFSLDSFHHDKRNGKLGHEEQMTFDPGDGSVNPGLIQIIAAAMSPGGQNLYTVGFFGGNLNVWRITEKSHEPGEPAAADTGAGEDGNPPN